MRTLFCFTAAIAVMGAQQAQAQACPERITSQVEQTLGPEIAWLEDEVRVHRPANMRLIGRPIPYVMVERVSDWEVDPSAWPIKTLSFRLGGIGRQSGEDFPIQVIRAFDRAYPGSGCEISEDLHCREYIEDIEGLGRLRFVQLIDPDMHVPDDARGDLRQIRADEEYSDAGAPGFLVCEYRTD